MSKIAFQKPALSVEQQIQRLKTRGMNISNLEAAKKLLSSVSYYRLSAYWYPFRVKTQTQVQSEFEQGMHLDKAVLLYEFDRQLRLKIIDAIERVEISLRTLIVNQLANKYDPFFYAKASNFHPQFNHQNWFNGVMDEVKRSSDEFIAHYSKKYTDFPVVPIWCVTEVMSLGKLSFMLKGLKHDDKKDISSHYNLHHKRLVDWMHVITYVRNVCAHHSRLWNRELAIRPDQTKELHWLPPATPRNDRVFTFY